MPEELNSEEMSTVRTIEEYENDLIEAAESNSPEIFSNHDENHAASAMSILFRNTSKKMCLIVNNFNGKVSSKPKYYEALRDCLEKGVSADILTLNPPNPESKGYQVFLEYQKKDPTKIRIFLANDEAKEEIRKRMNKIFDFGETHNLGVFDDNKYRLEYWPSKYRAFLSFFDLSITSKHKKTFESAFSKVCNQPLNA